MSNPPAANVPKRLTDRIARWMRHRGWAAEDNTLRHRIHDAVYSYRRWYDWANPLMALVGRDDSGHWGPPRVRDMWFRREADGTFTTTRKYSDVLDRNDGEWRIFDAQDDGSTIVIGYWPHPDGNGRIQRSGIDGRAEQRLFLRWFVWDGIVKAEWLGLRRWLYFKALHSSVERRIPFTCQAVPPRNSGGYRHWHCQLKKRHAGPHRFVNYTWADGEQVEYAPVDLSVRP